MNRSESRYFATAARMDEAFLTLLAKKDFEYITIKEICEVAGVNRSTFYLHYETMSDLLSESVGRMNKQFLASMEKDSVRLLSRISLWLIDKYISRVLVSKMQCFVLKKWWSQVPTLIIFYLL